MKIIRLVLIATTLLCATSCRDVELATVQRGFRWYKRGDYDRAIETFSSVLGSNPTNKYALAGRGDAFAEKKEYAKALEDYDAAIESHPDWASVYYHRGVCWQEYAKLRGWYDEDKLIKALADYTKAIELDPSTKAAYINRAFINKMMGNYESALTDYETLLRLEPQNERAKAEREKTLKAIKEGAKPKIREEAPPE